jgi:hypothetical protein
MSVGRQIAGTGFSGSGLLGRPVSAAGISLVQHISVLRPAGQHVNSGILALGMMFCQAIFRFASGVLSNRILRTTKQPGPSTWKGRRWHFRESTPSPSAPLPINSVQVPLIDRLCAVDHPMSRSFTRAVPLAA